MRRHIVIWLSVLTLLIAVQAVAGLGHSKKCELSTQECLNRMVTKLKTSGWVGIEMDIDKETGK